MSCGTSPMRRLVALPSSPTGTPPMVTDPRSGMARPHSMATVVDLPAPLGPSRPTISPAFTSSVTPETAAFFPYDFHRSLACSMAPPFQVAPEYPGRRQRGLNCDEWPPAFANRQLGSDPSCARHAAGV